MNKKRLGPAPDWITTASTATTTEVEDSEPSESPDPLAGIFAASRNVRLGDQEDDALLEAYREALSEVTDSQIVAEIKSLLALEQKAPAPFAELYVAPRGTTDVRDTRPLRLVFLPIDHTHSGGSTGSVALRKAQIFLDSHGVGPRRYRNALVFVAPDAARAQELMDDVRAQLGWRTLVESPATARLEPRYLARARAHLAKCTERLDNALREAYSWSLVPTQAGPESSVEWREALTTGDGTLPERTANALASLGLLHVDDLGLADEIGKARPWLGNSIPNAGLLVEEFARNVYLPRVSDEQLLQTVLQSAISASIQPQSRLGGQRRPFQTAVRVDPRDLLDNGGQSARFIERLLSVVGPTDLKVTLQVEGIAPESLRAELEQAIADLRKPVNP